MRRDRYLAMILRLLIWLNVLDTLLTCSVVGMKWATEANPIMALFLSKGPLIFGAVKMSLTVGGATAMWMARKKTKWNVIRIGTALVLCYSLVVTYEAVMIGAMVFG